MISGKASKLTGLSAADPGLPPVDRPRIAVLFCCEASAAAPALIESGVPIVLGMRTIIPDSFWGEALISSCISAMTAQELSLEEAVIRWRLGLEVDNRVSCESVHFSVPILYMANNT